MQEAGDCLLAHAHGYGGMLRQTRAQLGDPPLEVPRLHDLAEKAGRQRLLGGEVLRSTPLHYVARRCVIMQNISMASAYLLLQSFVDVV